MQIPCGQLFPSTSPCFIVTLEERQELIESPVQDLPYSFKQWKFVRLTSSE